MDSLVPMDNEVRHGFSTLAIHAGQEPDPLTGAVVPPIYQVSTYKQDGVGGLRGGYEYSPHRPTRPAPRSRSASPRSRAARAGWRSPSGWPPRTPAARGLPPGRPRRHPERRVRRHLPAVRARSPSRGASSYTRSPLDDVDGGARGDPPGQTKVVWVETPTNPLLGIADIAALADVAHDAGRAAGRRQHVRHALPAAAAGARRRRGRALDHQVPRRPLRRGRRRAGRSRTPSWASGCAFHQNAMGAVAGPFDAWLVLRGHQDARRADGPALRQRGADRRDAASGTRPSGRCSTRGCPATPATRSPPSR